MATKKKAVSKKKATSKTVYRSTVTGGLISKKKALKLDPSLYTVETMATGGNAPVATRTVYRNNATGKLISKTDALALAASTYTIEEMPVDPADPSLNGLKVELTGDWGETPVLSAVKGSDDRRGSICITPGKSPRTGNAAAPSFAFTFAKKHKATPFVILSCWRKQGEGVSVYPDSSDATNYVVTDSSLTVTDHGSLIDGAEIVYDYLITD